MPPMNLIFQSLGPLNEPVEPILSANLRDNLQRQLSIALTCNLPSHNTHVPCAWYPQHLSFHRPSHLSRNLTDPLTILSVLALSQTYGFGGNLCRPEESSSDLCARKIVFAAWNGEKSGPGSQSREKWGVRGQFIRVIRY